MKYLIVGPLAAVSLLLWAFVGYCIYLGVTDSWIWFLVGTGFCCTAVVASGTTIAGFDTIKDW